MKSSKVRRHAGRRYPKLIRFGMKTKEIINLGLEPGEYWNDWVDFRDGLRFSKDRTLIRNKNMSFIDEGELVKQNKKLKLLLKRRIARKEKIKSRTRK